MDFTKMTVVELRVLSKQKGLPVYQYKGKRLKKQDLIRQIQEKMTDTVTDTVADTVTHVVADTMLATPRYTKVDQLQNMVHALTEALLHKTEAYDLPPDPIYSEAMRRVLVRHQTPRGKDLRVLTNRRRQAAAMLCDSFDPLVRRHFVALRQEM